MQQFSLPTDIQSEANPAILGGGDVLLHFSIFQLPTFIFRKCMKK
jgi:hypothetical protein